MVAFDKNVLIFALSLFTKLKNYEKSFTICICHAICYGNDGTKPCGFAARIL